MTSITQDDLLSAYAAGTTSPGLSLLCATHLTLSPQARGLVATAESIGGAMLAEEATTDVAPMNFEALLARLDEPEPLAPRLTSQPPCARDGDDIALPRPIQRALGDTPTPPWRFRLPGIHEYVFDGYQHERVSLLKARPGAKIPKHTHEGDEATLLLSGALQDGDTVLRTGDLSIAGPEHDHTPEIMGDDICICLVVNNGALRFTGRFGRALNLFAE
ncbi:MAG: ChrR family anti-sigma-E factor [Rhodobacteraceae bacterium]|nr:ChrR family anti-sigma-E factor [Paracoccaceae bacterium]